MNTAIEVLPPDETSAILANGPYGRENSKLAAISEALTQVVDTGAGVYVVGLTESVVNALRSKMRSKGIKVMARKTRRDGSVGHVFVATTIPQP